MVLGADTEGVGVLEARQVRGRPAGRVWVCASTREESSSRELFSRVFAFVGVRRNTQNMAWGCRFVTVPRGGG